MQPEIEEDDCNAPIDDLEKGMPGSDNTMNDEAGRDADMEFGGRSLPPIDDKKRANQDKAAAKAAKDLEECQKFKTMTLDEKKKALDAYNPQDYYVKNAYIDAQDTTNVPIMGKIINATSTDVQVNYDGWSDKWNAVSTIISLS